MRNLIIFLFRILNVWVKPYNILSNIIALYLNNVKYERGLKISGRLFIRNKGSIILRKNITINSSSSANPIGGDIKTRLITSKNGHIEIKEGVGISNSTINSNYSIIIEENVLIGGSCKIYDTDFHSLRPEKRIGFFKDSIFDTDSVSKPILIKSNAWIGGHCIILKGVEIGNNSIIGAGSVVTKNVPDNELWAGNPARFIKKIF